MFVRQFAEFSDMTRSSVRNRPPSIVISGMHRSCTSLLAQGLQAAGLFVGDRLIERNWSNPDGHFEDRDFFDIACRILVANGLPDTGFVDNAQIVVPASLRTAAADLVEQRQSLGIPWGWKDPRTVLLLPLWRELLPNAHFVFSFRAPWEVANSLYRRRDSAMQSDPFLAFRVWNAYNTLILSLAKDSPEYVTLVDARDVQGDLAACISRISARSGLSLVPSAECVRPDLVRHELEETYASLAQVVSPGSIDLYRGLCACAGTNPVPVGAGDWWSRPGALDARMRDWAGAAGSGSLARELSESVEVVAKASAALASRDAAVSGLETRRAELESALASRGEELRQMKDLLGQRANAIGDLELLVRRLMDSNSMRLTAPLRALRSRFGSFFRISRASVEGSGCPSGQSGSAMNTITFGRIRSAFGYIYRRDIRGLLARLRHSLARPTKMASRRALAGGDWCILATPHTSSLGSNLASALVRFGLRAELRFDLPSEVSDAMYIVLCPQAFRRLPPPERRIVFQLEQSVSSRWFSEEYIQCLRSSFAVFDYSLRNIEFLARHGIAFPHVHYLPVGPSRASRTSNQCPAKSVDVLFYGDYKSSLRRQRLIDAVRAEFSVKVCDETFGEQMAIEITRARVVLNLHYYENALLETPRIQECISLGVPVVSEATDDMSEYPELAGAVQFFPQGDVVSMIAAIRRALDEPQFDVGRAAELGANRFEFMVGRALVALGAIPAERVLMTPPPHGVDGSNVVLSMPETIGRRRAFESTASAGSFVVFDGLRKSPGWVGCGLSYKKLALDALSRGVSRLLIVEDDVLLPADFESRIRLVHSYLDRLDGEGLCWDVFSGVMAVVREDTRVIRRDEHEGKFFVTVDRMTSTVCNIYSVSGLRRLAAWDPVDTDPVSNTIDRYLERQADLRVVVELPFLAGHREDQPSTLWGFENTTYRTMIASAEQSLVSKVAQFSRLQAEVPIADQIPGRT